MSVHESLYEKCVKFTVFQKLQEGNVDIAAEMAIQIENPNPEDADAIGMWRCVGQVSAVLIYVVNQMLRLQNFTEEKNLPVAMNLVIQLISKVPVDKVPDDLKLEWSSLRSYQFEIF